MTATIVGAVTLLVGLIEPGLDGGARSTTSRTARSPTSRDAATARIEGYNAKSNESLTLIARGSGGSFEEAWKTSAAIVEDSISRGSADDFEVVWQPYVDVHTADPRARRRRAVGQGRGAGHEPSPNTTFTAFDDQRRPGGRQRQRRDRPAGSAAAVPWMIIGAILILIAGIVMAVLGRRGLAQRLKEYR